MRVQIRATEDAIIRLLRAGHPLPGTVVKRPEDTRLPVFQNVEAQPVKNFGIDSPARIVVARGRKDVWFVDIKRRSGKLGKDEGSEFLQLRDRLQAQYKGQKVTGWLVTTAEVEDGVHDEINAKECFATARAALR